MAALAGRSPRTPIGMKELWDEVQNLKDSQIRVKAINSSTTSVSSSEQTIVSLTTTSIIYAHLSVTFTGANGSTKEINRYGDTTNFSSKVEADGNWSSGYRSYAILTKNGSSVSLKTFLRVDNGSSVKIKGFIVY